MPIQHSTELIFTNPCELLILYYLQDEWQPSFIMNRLIRNGETGYKNTYIPSIIILSSVLSSLVIVIYIFIIFWQVRKLHLLFFNLGINYCHSNQCCRAGHFLSQLRPWHCPGSRQRLRRRSPHDKNTLFAVLAGKWIFLINIIWPILRIKTKTKWKCSYNSYTRRNLAQYFLLPSSGLRMFRL